MQSLDNIVEYEDKRPKLWDSLITAYGSSRGVRMGIDAVNAGYSIPLAAAVSVSFYLTAKTGGIIIKNFVNFLRQPIIYFKNIKNSFYDAVEFYKPFGRYKNPTILGATLSAANYMGV